MEVAPKQCVCACCSLSRRYFSSFVPANKQAAWLQGDAAGVCGLLVPSRGQTTKCHGPVTGNAGACSQLTRSHFRAAFVTWFCHFLVP